MEKKYSALRIIGTIYKVLGVIAGVLTVLAVLGLCITGLLGGAAANQLSHEFGGSGGASGLFGGVFGGLLLSVLAIFYGGGIAVTLYAFGEGIYLLLALEENTRLTASLLRSAK